MTKLNNLLNTLGGVTPDHLMLFIREIVLRYQITY